MSPEPLKGALKEQVKTGNADFQLHRTIRSDDRTMMARKYADMERASTVNQFLDCPGNGVPPHAEPLLSEAKVLIRKLQDQNTSGALSNQIDRICSSGIVAQLLANSLDKLSVGNEKRREMEDLAFHLLGTILYRPESFDSADIQSD